MFVTADYADYADKKRGRSLNITATELRRLAQCAIESNGDSAVLQCHFMRIDRLLGIFKANTGLQIEMMLVDR